MTKRTPGQDIDESDIDAWTERIAREVAVSDAMLSQHGLPSPEKAGLPSAGAPAASDAVAPPALALCK
jgi:hypothetical protein